MYDYSLMCQYTVYAIRCNTTKKEYVGVTSGSLRTRINQHIAKHQQYKLVFHSLYLDMICYGVPDFDYRSLEIFTSQRSIGVANKKEAEWIKKLNTGYPNGYNEKGFRDTREEARERKKSNDEFEMYLKENNYPEFPF